MENVWGQDEVVEHWEYKVRNVELDNLGLALDRYGRHGWELVTVMPFSFHVKLIFKRLRAAKHLTKSVAIQFDGEETMNSVTLNVGQSTTGTVRPLEADGVTVTPGATVSHASFTIADPAVGVTDNGDGTVTIKGLAAGTVTGTVQANVTDQDSATGTFSGSFTVTVNAAPTGLTTSIGVDFSDPA